MIPGLIDGFAVLNNQSYANAYLACGVTSIFGVGDSNWRRGPMKYDCDPSPHIYRFGSIGYSDREGGKVFATPAEYMEEVTRMHASGIRVLLLHYQLEPDAVTALARHCRTLGIATIGELGYTSYGEAIASGVDSFVHTQRYSLDIAPPALRRAIGNAPFDPDNLRPYIELIDNLPPDDPRLLAHARLLGTSRCGLITTLAMAYPDLPGARNPWTWPAAAILKPEDIHAPCDPQTGARYLAGSGTDAFGTMPGISLHQELELLVRAGLSPRQALAAAVGSEATASQVVTKVQCGRSPRMRRCIKG